MGQGQEAQNMGLWVPVQDNSIKCYCIREPNAAGTGELQTVNFSRRGKKMELEPPEVTQGEN